jgi:hypothetical protein
MNNASMNTPKSFRIGDLVSFGRAHGEKTRGKVIRVSAKSVSVQTIEERGSGRGSSVGKMWRVHPSLITHDSSPVERAERNNPAALEAATSNFVEIALHYGLSSQMTRDALTKLAALRNGTHQLSGSSA